MLFIIREKLAVAFGANRQRVFFLMGSFSIVNVCCFTISRATRQERSTTSPVRQGPPLRPWRSGRYS